MKKKVLIQLLGEPHHASIVAALQCGPTMIIFLRPNIDTYDGMYKDIKGFLLKKNPLLTIRSITIDLMAEGSIEEALTPYHEMNLIINLSGGHQLLGLLLYRWALCQNRPCLYIDINSNQCYVVGQSNTTVQPCSSALDIKDMVEAIGGNITRESTQIFNEFKYHRLIRYLISHYKMWCVIKQLIRKPEIMYSEQDSLQAVVYLKELSQQEKRQMSDFLTHLIKLGIIQYYKDTQFEINLTFFDRKAKNFVMVSGSWLEAFTFQLIESLPNIADVRSGVKFLWDDDVKEVENELDVCVVNHGALTCISCKDTDVYDVNTLNELRVYAEKLGGSQVKKILVTTAPPKKETLILRAEEMGIHLIIFQGNVNQFKKSLEALIIK